MRALIRRGGITTNVTCMRPSEEGAGYDVYDDELAAPMNTLCSTDSIHNALRVRDPHSLDIGAAAAAWPRVRRRAVLRGWNLP